VDCADKKGEAMEQVFAVYGKFMIEAAAVCLLIVLLFTGVKDEEGNQGVLKIAGSLLPVLQIDYETYADYTVLIAEAKKEAPTISFQSEESILPGKRKISDYIIAQDYSKNRILVQIRSIENPQGEDVSADFDSKKMIMNFKEAGIYTFRVFAEDDGGRRTEKQILIPVNREGGEL
jgi:hypothetical protein